MRGRIDEGMPRMANERLPQRSIPDRSPGHAFMPQSVITADSGPSSAPAGDKPPHYIFSFRSVYDSAGFAGGESASKLIGGLAFGLGAT